MKDTDLNHFGRNEFDVLIKKFLTQVFHRFFASSADAVFFIQFKNQALGFEHRHDLGLPALFLRFASLLATLFYCFDRIQGTVQEKSDGRWALPGGWADAGFSPSEIAEKETLEEAGLVVRASKLIKVVDKAKSELIRLFLGVFHKIRSISIAAQAVSLCNLFMPGGLFGLLAVFL